MRDGADSILRLAVRWLTEDRRGWGRAMLAELAHLQGAWTRWRFALGCARAVFLRAITEQMMKPIFSKIGMAGLASLILVLPFALMELLNNEINSRNATGLALLFGLLWLLPLAGYFTAEPIVRSARVAASVPANSLEIFLRGALLIFIAMIWGALLIDQFPCFLGLPNCD